MSRLGPPIGYRVVWQHPGGDWFTGDLWQMREDAEHIATMLRESGWCFNVRIRRAWV